MATAVMKVEVESETCCVCGGGSDLVSPEEYDAAAPPLSPPLRSVLARLAGGGGALAPDGRLCTQCLQRALEAHEFATALRARAPPPLSDKIRALRRRLAELTQKIDVFIVVGGGSDAGGGGARAYSEDDIIMVERGALAAAAEPAHARNARGDHVYQCSVCPFSFQTAADYRTHVAFHPEDALHSCWTCGVQFQTRMELYDHTAETHPATATVCYLCNNSFQSQLELKRHESSCPSVCPLCGASFPSRAQLGAHCVQQHGRANASPASPAPLLCPVCYSQHANSEGLTAHLLMHRQQRHFVCGYGDCVLRFPTRATLMAHIRKAHHAGDAAATEGAEGGTAPTPTAPNTCRVCQRTFGNKAALQRHHCPGHPDNTKTEAMLEDDGDMQTAEVGEGQTVMYVQGDETGGVGGVMYVQGEGGEVEYLEVETLDEEFDIKPQLHA